MSEFYDIDELMPWFGKKDPQGTPPPGGGGTPPPPNDNPEPEPEGEWDEDDEQDGENKPAPGESEPGEDEEGDGPGKGDGETGEGEPGKGSKGDAEDKDGDSIWDEIDRRESEIGRNSEKDAKDREDSDGEEKDGSGSTGPKKKDSSGPGNARGSVQEFDWSKIRSAHSWKEILKLLIVTASRQTEETRKKPPRNIATGISVGAELDAYALPASEMPTDGDLKLLIVLDSSGSMMSIAAHVFAEVDNLLKQSGARAKSVALIKFSDTHAVYRCNFAKKTSSMTKHWDDKATNWKPNLHSVLSTSTSGGTVFNHSVAADIELAIKDGYNVIVFTDSDILAMNNWSTFSHLYHTHQKQFFAMFDSHRTFTKACQELKQRAKNFTHFK